MSHPRIVDIPNREWVLVAEGVHYGTLDKKQDAVIYYQTYRPTGQTGPDAPFGSTVPDEAVKIFQGTDQEEINSDIALDVYIYCKPENTGIDRPGRVRVAI